MKTNFKLGIIFLIFFLLVTNICLFTKSLFLGDNNLKIEKEINKLKIVNSELEKELSSLTSIQNLTEVASLLGFTNKSEPIYLENFKYASRK